VGVATVTQQPYARRSARVILADDADRLLLFESEGFWFTPVILGVLLGVVAWVRRTEVPRVLER